MRDEGLSIAALSVRTNRRQEATVRLTVAQLARLLRRIETVRGVIAVSRDGTRAR